MLGFADGLDVVNEEKIKSAADFGLSHEKHRALPSLRWERLSEGQDLEGRLGAQCGYVNFEMPIKCLCGDIK